MEMMDSFEEQNCHNQGQPKTKSPGRLYSAWLRLIELSWVGRGGGIHFNFIFLLALYLAWKCPKSSCGGGGWVWPSRSILVIKGSI